MSQGKITLITELDRVHLRFLKVPDNKKLSDIMAKLLPNILSIYFEWDLVNEAMNPEQPKIKAIENIVQHLMQKTTNSRGEVKVPFQKLIAIFSSDAYLRFTNVAIKAHAKNRIFDFIFAQYAYLDADNLAGDMDNIFIPVMTALSNLNDSSHEKCTLLSMWLHRLVHYYKLKQLPAFLTLLTDYLKDKPVVKAEVFSCFFNFVICFQQPDNVPLNVQAMTTHITQAMNFMFSTFQDNANIMEDTWSNCVMNAQLIILRILQDNHNDLLAVHENIPFILLMSYHHNGAIKDQAEAYLKSYIQEIDKKDAKLVNAIFVLLNNENIFKLGPPDENEEMVLGDEKKEMPILTKKYMIDFLMKFDCSFEANEKKTLKLIDSCIKKHGDFLSYALKLINHMIKTDANVYLADPNAQQGFGIVQQLKFLLIQIRNLEDRDSDQVLIQLAQAEVYVCFADLASRDYNSIFNQNFSISMMTIEVFQKLKERVAEIDKIKPIREDDLCLILLMALNKFRDLILEHASSDASIFQEKEMLLSLVTKLLNKELKSISQNNNNDVIYVLFLYLTDLDKRKDVNTGKEVPNPAILLYSVSLKEHEDIKIRKEAIKQIEIFEKLEDQSGENKILPDLMAEVNKFFTRNEIFIFEDLESFEDHMNFKQGVQFQKTHYTQLLVEQCLEVSRFTIKFLEQEYTEKVEGNDELDKIIDDMERQMVMNINQNFGNFKSDFTEPLELIYKLLQISIKLGQKARLSTIKEVGSTFIFRLLKRSSNLDQSIKALQLLNKIIICMDDEQKSKLFTKINLAELIGTFQHINEEKTKVSHEMNLQNIMYLTLYGLLQPGNQETVISIFDSKITQASINQEKSLTPNVADEIKMLIVAISQISKLPALKNICTSVFTLILSILKNKAIQPPLRLAILGCLHKILAIQDVAFIKKTCLQVLEIYVPFEESKSIDTQIQVGKFMAKAVKLIDANACDQEGLNDYVQHFMIGLIKCREKKFQWKQWEEPKDAEVIKEEKMEDEPAEGEQIVPDETKIEGYDVTLNSRRNCVIYLNEILQVYAKSETLIQEKFVEIQKIFLKYIFDKKPSIQDISSKALTLIYKTGSAEIKESLVQSLSSTLTGDEHAQKVGTAAFETNDEKDEDRELNLGINDSSSTDQRKKLKTYKDLCRIAVDIGHKEMIYQFLEVHRHLTHYQDVQNAAKGLANIMMLDDRLKDDLMKITPKILLLTYDYDEGVRDTMRQLWGTLISVEQEPKVIEEKWPEILAEALSYMKQKEWRKRLSASLVLQDLLPNRTWADIKDRFKDVFLGSLILLNDDVESVKKSAGNLCKTIKRLTMKFANIYANNDIEELKEVLSIVIPMTIDEVIKSMNKAVKFFGVDLLFEIVKSSTQEKMYQSLKIQNKYERQIAFSYNSEEKMKEILNVYLDRIIIEVLSNLSQMNGAVDKINQIEQYAIDQGLYSNSKDSARNAISDGQLNNMRIQYTKDSAWGEILTICRRKMTQETFDKIVNDLINLMIKGHDLVTKSSAITFVQDVILENKEELIKPQNSKKIAQKLVDIYSQNSVSTCLSLRSSLLQLYASCIGLQFKILHAFPQTTQALVDQIIALPDELETIKTMTLYEIIKNLPAEVLRHGGENQQMLVHGAIPMLHINRYKTNDQQLRTMSERMFKYIEDELTEADEDEGAKKVNIELQNSENIFLRIHALFDSNNYDERISAGLAMEDLSVKMQSYELGQSDQVKLNIQKMFELISSKYFNNKEVLIDSFSKVMSLMDNESPWIKDPEFLSKYVSMTLKQIEKFDTSNQQYKNKIISCLNECLTSTAKNISTEQMNEISNMILFQLSSNLESVSENQGLGDNNKQTTFDEKKDSDKQILATIMNCYKTLAIVWHFVQPSHDAFLDVCKEKYSTTNFLVRNSILKMIVQVIKSKEYAGKYPDQVFDLGNYIFSHTAKCGEKYDINLALLSELCVTISSADIPIAYSEEMCKNSQVLVQMLQAKGGDELLMNIDLIRSNFTF